jgi:amino acid adenylation domain-containing protein
MRSFGRLAKLRDFDPKRWIPSADHGDLRQSVADMVAAVAARSPDAVALRAGGARMTYGELLAGADRLAEEIRRRGVAPDVPVGVCLERSFDQIVAILGIMRAGDAFIPLDPAWPDERLRKLLDDAQAPVVITGHALADRLSGKDRVALSLEKDVRATAIPRSPIVARIGGDHLAYIIYTSGSTGEPKGVEISHSNLRNLVAWHRQAFGVTGSDRAPYLAGLGFDASVWEIWPYLTVGAYLFLPDETVRSSPELLRRWLIAERITIAFVPTPLAEPMIAVEWPANSALRFLLTGGDTLHLWPRPDLPFAVVNNYGPTECTVVATSGVVPAARGSSSLPAIGRPISNTQIHLLDARGRPVRDGEIGEITIGGAGVGRGYHNNPRLTAEKFVTDAFRENASGARLYRTDDLGRRLPDGLIAFHGRIDDQLKIRGYRVEPDEIAAALNRHPLIAQSAVVGHGDAADKRLIAYFVPMEAAEPDSQDLRDFLAASLPLYMLPSSFIRLAALPLTASGKLDRAALPEPTPADERHEAAYRAPESMTERRLAEIIAELLQLERVGADDNFFLLGGHSLLGTQLVLRARDAFAVDLTLRHLFEAQTVANLAARIEQLVIDRLVAMSEKEVQQLIAE